MERIARTPRQLGAAIHLRRNGFRLALAVGGNRHYVMDEILPRHFARTAARAGTPVGTVAGICAELADTAEGAIEAALNSLPESFPADLADSIVGGLRARLGTIGRSPA